MNLACRHFWICNARWKKPRKKLVFESLYLSSRTITSIACDECWNKIINFTLTHWECCFTSSNKVLWRNCHTFCSSLNPYWLLSLVTLKAAYVIHRWFLKLRLHCDKVKIVFQYLELIVILTERIDKPSCTELLMNWQQSFPFRHKSISVHFCFNFLNFPGCTIFTWPLSVVLFSFNLHCWWIWTKNIHLLDLLIKRRNISSLYCVLSQWSYIAIMFMFICVTNKS